MMVPARSISPRPPSARRGCRPSARIGPGSMAATRKRYQALAHLGPVEAEDLHRHAELEGAQAVVGERHHQAVGRRLRSSGAALARSLRSLAFAPLVAHQGSGVKCCRSPERHPAPPEGEPPCPATVTATPPRAALRSGQRISRTSWRSRPTAGTYTSRLKDGAPDFVLLDVRGRAGLRQGACAGRAQSAARRDHRRAHDGLAARHAVRRLLRRARIATAPTGRRSKLSPSSGGP